MEVAGKSPTGIESSQGHSVKKLHNSNEENQPFMFRVKFRMPTQCSHALLRNNSKVKKEIEAQNKVRIEITDNAGSNIVISGNNNDNITLAANKIESVLTSIRKSSRPTHIIMFPLRSQNLMHQFHIFKAKVMEKYSTEIEESVFQIPIRIHLSILLPRLLEETEEERAKMLLLECSKFVSEVFINEPVQVHLRGVDVMRDEPELAHVLYAKVVHGDRLQKVADGIVQKFVDTKLHFQEWSHVKLHATLMNTIWCKSKGAKKSGVSFDARGIIEEFKDFSFGIIDLKEIQFCLIRKAQGGNYIKVSSIALPNQCNEEVEDMADQW